MNIKNLLEINSKYYTLDLNTKEKRNWDPNRSKICAGLKKGARLPFYKTDATILYLGCAEGYTCSFISDIFEDGKIYSVDFSAHSMQKFVMLAKERENLIPILWDANTLYDYEFLKNEKMDIIIQDVSQKNQIEILEKNIEKFLKPEGYFVLSLKLSAISQKNTKEIIETELKKLEHKYKIIDRRKLDPFEKKHILIIGKKN